MKKEEISNTIRSKKGSAKHTQTKHVEILGIKCHTPSPHVLDLKLHSTFFPASVPARTWQPNTFHEFLAHPINFLKKPNPKFLSFPKTPVLKTSPRFRRFKQFILGFTQQIKNDMYVLAGRIKIMCITCIRRVLFPFSAANALFKAVSANMRLISLRLRSHTRNLQKKIRTSIKPKKYIWKNVWFKTASAFVATAVLLITPVQALSTYSTLKKSRATVQTQGVEAFQSLKASGNAFLTVENNDAVDNVQTALALFNKTNNELTEISFITRALLHLSPSHYVQYETGKHILRAGELISRALLPLTTSFETLKNRTEIPLTDRILSFQKAIHEAIPSIIAANIELRDINTETISPQYRDQFQTVQSYLNNIEDGMRAADPLFGLLYEMLGGTSDRRYLIVFQNNTEMRATGGFIGSFALLDVSRGELKQIRFPNGGSYDLQGYLKTSLEPPAPLKLLRTKWEFQDANWFPDFPASARKLAWFYEKSGGATVDGVIALDTHILIDLLKLTGPLTIPTFNKIVSADNAIVAIQTEVEMNYDHQINEPKRFLGATIEEIIKKIKNDPSKTLPILSILQSNLVSRHLQLMSFHGTEQQAILDHDWGGALKDNAEGDFLAVINSNIGGQKTDGVITQKMRLQTTIQNDGSIINTLTIERAHRGVSGEIFYGAPNINYIRVLVPKGSTFITSTGFSYPEESMVKIPDEHYAIDQDLMRVETGQKTDEASGTVINTQFEKTAFANWIITKPGETSIATITYRLPFNAFAHSKKSFIENLNQLFGLDNEQLIKYSILVQKQAGMEDNDFTHHLTLPAPTETIWMTPADWNIPTDHSYEIKIKSFGDIFNGFVGKVKKS